jgi:hypothetical protein
MPNRPPLDANQLMRESMALPGALGAIAYGVLKGLEAGGADASVVSSMHLLMQEHFQQLSDADCNALCDVVYARLQHEAARGGRWYSEDPGA